MTRLLSEMVGSKGQGLGGPDGGRVCYEADSAVYFLRVAALLCARDDGWVGQKVKITACLKVACGQSFDRPIFIYTETGFVLHLVFMYNASQRNDRSPPEGEGLLRRIIYD